MKLFFSLLLATLLTSVGSVSRGQGYEEKAFEAFEHGKQLFRAEEFTNAANAFRTANFLNPNWKLYFNIGQSEAAAKRHGLALEAFETYLAKGGDEVSFERQRVVQEEIDRLQRIVGFLKVNAPKGSEISVDGVKRGDAPIVREIPVAASVEHTLVGTLDGETIAEQVFQVSGGRTTTIELTKLPAPGDSDVPEPEPEVETSLEPQMESPVEEGKPLRTWGWVCVGVGGATLVGAGVTGIAALKKKGQVEENCPGGCYTEHYDLVEKRDDLALATDVLLGVGGAVAATGVVLLLVDAFGGERSEADIAFVPSPGAFAIFGRF